MKLLQKMNEVLQDTNEDGLDDGIVACLYSLSSVRSYGGKAD